MTNVVRRMIDVAHRAPQTDVRSSLQSSKRGTRLFAYAYLYARPDSVALAPLVDSVTTVEDKPFGQYCGLQATGRVLAVTDVVPGEVKSRLQVFQAKLPSGTDRDYEVKKLLRQM